MSQQPTGQLSCHTSKSRREPHLHPGRVWYTPYAVCGVRLRPPPDLRWAYSIPTSSISFPRDISIGRELLIDICTGTAVWQQRLLQAANNNLAFMTAQLCLGLGGLR